MFPYTNRVGIAVSDIPRLPCARLRQSANIAPSSSSEECHTLLPEHARLMLSQSFELCGFAERLDAKDALYLTWQCTNFSPCPNLTPHPEPVR